MGCRSKERAEKAIIELQSEVHQASLEFMELDLADFESIKNFVKTYQAKHDHLDVLVSVKQI
jgi:NADP-dependent 3-hydroxy acid dehydrogenase YdfG